MYLAFLFATTTPDDEADEAVEEDVEDEVVAFWIQIKHICDNSITLSFI